MRDREYRDRHKSGDCGINNTYKKGKIRPRDETKIKARLLTSLLLSNILSVSHPYVHKTLMRAIITSFLICKDIKSDFLITENNL